MRVLLMDVPAAGSDRGPFCKSTFTSSVKLPLLIICISTIQISGILLWSSGQLNRNDPI